MLGPVRDAVFWSWDAKGFAQGVGGEIGEDEGRLEVGSDDMRLGGQEGRDAEDVVVVAVSAEDDVLLAVGVKTLAVVGGEGVGL